MSRIGQRILAALVLSSLVALTGLGCNSAGRRSSGAATSSSVPSLAAAGGDDKARVAVVEPGVSTATVSESNAMVDRHPLFRKPYQYYESTNSNKFVKTAAATFVGVPAGILGEFRQIVVGVPGGATRSSY